MCDSDAVVCDSDAAMCDRDTVVCMFVMIMRCSGITSVIYV